jgi:Ca2+-binding EF-hand superfamily protein
MFTPASDGLSYGASVQDISQLPTDPVGGKALTLGDDDSIAVALTSSAGVSIYGTNYSSFYVGSNGYITFTEADIEYSDSLANHFDTQRISALFRDLNPSSAGQVSWKQTSDRVAVTWQNVPQYGNGATNTFQVEMYFDGRIQISWLEIATQNCIVGISDGLGVPDDFEETDFSEIGTTTPPQDYGYLTEYFSTGTDVFDLTYKSITLTPTSGLAYAAGIEDISVLPTDPAGGKSLALGDDASATVTLSSSAAVSIYGSSFSTFYVGSNGYITFTEADNDYSESLADHFDTMRISALFSDLNPSASGQVSYKQLTDRVAVTWQNIPQYGSASSNTFQVIMYFDGRIQISWLDVGAQKCIAGISEGLGVPDDFEETDISEIGSSGPPPVTGYSTEQFTSSDAFDLPYTSVMFTPASGGTAYSAVAQNIVQLPTSPTGGKSLSLGDDASVSVTLSSSAVVSIFGDGFSTFYVGSNGYITFTEADNDYSESLADHFDTMRISALFTDLNPSASGQVSWKQLVDRVAVTWENVQQYGSTNTNTFQIEMYFDGRIQISWLAASVQKGIVGLSDGQGVPEDFEETDFSEL